TTLAPRRSELSRLVLVSLLVPSVALAVPLRMSHQGRVLEAGGDPVQGAHTLRFALYAAATGGTAVWTETDALTLDNGYFATILGDGTPLDLDDLGGDLWLGITVDAGTELSPRQQLVSAPYA